MSVTDVALKQILMNQTAIMRYLMAIDPYKESTQKKKVLAITDLWNHTEMTNEVLALFAKKKEQS